MSILWSTLEKLDQTAISVLTRLEKSRKKESFREGIEKSVEDIRPPQKAIRFD